MITEVQQIQEQTNNHQEVIVNKSFTAEKAYLHAMEMLYSPPEEKSYVFGVVSLYEKCLDFPVRVQIEAISAIQEGIESVDVSIHGVIYKFAPFDILYIQFSKQVDQNIRRLNFDSYNEYEEMFSYIWEQIYIGILHYNYKISKPVTYITDIIWKRIIVLSKKFVTHGKYNEFISDEEWRKNYTPNFAPKLIENLYMPDIVERSLDENQIELFKLRYVCDMTLQEIADVYGVERMAISYRLKNVHQYLKQKIQGVDRAILFPNDDLFVDVDFEA